MTELEITNLKIKVAGNDIYLQRGGSGRPLIILHNDMGGSGWLQLHNRLARDFTVYLPSLPGYGKSGRPEWMRSVRDMALVQNWLIKELGIGSTNILGIGIGAWVAAEMATMCHDQFNSMALVSPVGLQPKSGEIIDQFLLSAEEYVELCFRDSSKFKEIFGPVPSDEQKEAWELNREMTVRVAWKPYMFNQSLPYLLPGVTTPTLIVSGSDDKVVPLSCSEHYREVLPNSRLEVIKDCGHYVDMEKPNELAQLLTSFF